MAHFFSSSTTGNDLERVADDVVATWKIGASCPIDGDDDPAVLHAGEGAGSPQMPTAT
jgi:hypothetical protein